MIQQNMISELSDANDKWTGSHLSISESSVGHCGDILTPLQREHDSSGSQFVRGQ